MGKVQPWGPTPLVFGEGSMPHGEYPRVYERNVNVKVMETGGPQFRVIASLLDLEHSFHAELVVDIASGRIEDVSASMAKRPYPTFCPHALDNVEKLKGQVIGRGISRKIVELVGRSEGCVHLVEIFQAAIGFTATMLIGRRSGLEEEVAMSEEEHRQKWFPILRNSCQVFNEETTAEAKK
jgi:hypothetical protein